MNETGLSRRELTNLKETVDSVDFDPDKQEIIVQSTDYGRMANQYFPVTPEVNTTGQPILLNATVSKDGYTLFHNGDTGGEPSEEAYEAARQYARENTREILDAFLTLHEYRSDN